MSNYNDFPIQINSTNLPVPKVWSETPEIVEDVNVTEAGTDVVTVLRTDKLSVNASFDCSSAWLATFKGWNNATSSLTVKIYDAVTNNYVTRYMRMRNFNNNLVENSDKNSGTYGLWNVTFDLIEF